MASTKQQRAQLHAVANIHSSDALRRIQLVTANRIEIDAESLEIHRDLAGGLHAIDVKSHTGLSRDRRDLFYRLDRPQFVISVHHGNENGVRTQCRAYVIGIDNPIRSHADIRRIELPTNIQHRGMLNRRSYNMSALASDTEDREIIRLRAAAGKHNLARIAMQKSRDLPPRHFEPLLRDLPMMMDTGGVAIHFGHRRQEGFENLRRHRCRGVMVEVKAMHPNY